MRTILFFAVSIGLFIFGSTRRLESGWLLIVGTVLGLAVYLLLNYSRAIDAKWASIATDVDKEAGTTFAERLDTEYSIGAGGVCLVFDPLARKILLLAKSGHSVKGYDWIRTFALEWVDESGRVKDGSTRMVIETNDLKSPRFQLNYTASHAMAQRDKSRMEILLA